MTTGKWSINFIKEQGDVIYGNKVSYSHISIGIQIRSNSTILIECLLCSLIWNTTPLKFITHKKGCPWCQDQCTHLRNCTLAMIIFIGNKIHNGKYSYPDNKEENVKTVDDYINVWCGVVGHKQYREQISSHIKRKRNATRTPGCQGCPECNKLKEKKPKKKWKHNLDLLKSEGKRVHGDDYCYDNIDPLTIEKSNSVVNILCQRKKNGKICGNIFPQVISRHINEGCGCPCCGNNFKYNKEIFVKYVEDRYPGQFLFHRIMEEDITGYFSKPPVECADCGYVNKTSPISDYVRAEGFVCKRCKGREAWNAERVRYECSMKIKEGEYSYENVDLTKIEGKNTMIPISCLYCKSRGFEYIFEQNLLEHFMSMTGCPRCAGSMPWTYQRFKSDIPKIFLNNYNYDKVTEDMITSYASLIPIDCLKCGNEFKKKVGDHLVGLKGCTFCLKSDGSKMVYMLLKDMNIKFMDEIPCMGPNGRNLWYDYKFLYEGTWIILEYDGNISLKLFGTKLKKILIIVCSKTRINNIKLWKRDVK